MIARVIILLLWLLMIAEVAPEALQFFGIKNVTEDISRCKGSDTTCLF